MTKRSHGIVRTLVAVLVIVGGAAVGIRDLGAQSNVVAARWVHPRTPWGDPDLEGVWTSDNNFSIPLERPPEVADKEFLDGADLEAALGSERRRSPPWPMAVRWARVHRTGTRT